MRFSRRHTVLLSIKPHSTLAPYFKGTDIKADLYVYKDIFEYIRAMQPTFHNYSRQIIVNKLEESFTFLDANLKELTAEEMNIRVVKENDVLYIVPSIIGGSGKRGAILAIAAIAMVFMFPGVLGIAGTGAGAGAGALATPTISATGSTGFMAKAGAFLKSGSFMSRMVINVGLAALSSLFMRPSSTSSEETRQNNMFGSLTNSTNTGTPIALHYGMVRAAGQLVSGYIYTSSHGKTIEIDTYGRTISIAEEEPTSAGYDESEYYSTVDDIVAGRDPADYAGP